MKTWVLIFALPISAWAKGPGAIPEGRTGVYEADPRGYTTTKPVLNKAPKSFAAPARGSEPSRGMAMRGDLSSAEQPEIFSEGLFIPSFGLHMTGGFGLRLGAGVFGQIAGAYWMGLDFNYIGGIHLDEYENTSYSSSYYGSTYTDVSYKLLDWGFYPLEFVFEIEDVRVLLGASTNFAIVMGAQDGDEDEVEGMSKADVGIGGHFGFITKALDGWPIGAQLRLNKYFITSPTMISLEAIAAF